MVCPLTVDYDGFLLSLEDISTQTIPRGGTSLGRAIEEATQGYANVPNEYKSIIVITDGENLEGDPLKAAQKAKDKGIRIFTVGIGTQEGELIRIPNESGGFEFLKDGEGNFIKSRLNEGLLQQIALSTAGIYVRAGGARFGLDLIYEEQLSRMEKREVESKMEKKYYERFHIPLAAALALLLTETLITTRRRL